MSNVLLTPEDVAQRLHVSVRTARRIFHELPTINLSENQRSSRPRLRITEDTLEKFISGEISRKLPRGGKH